MIIVIFLLIVLLFIEQIYKEGFDEKITNATLENCARFCKMTSKCAGFSYDNKTNSCYPSITPILGKPGSSIYRDEYNKDLTTCNKTFTINEPMNESADTIKRANAIYRCYEPNKDEFFLMHNKDRLNQLNLNEPNNNEFNDYPIKPYVWPDKNDLVIAPVDWSMLDYNINDNSIDLVDVHTLNPNAGIITAYKLKNEMSTGNYYKTYQCVDDIELKDCLNFCTSKEECVGVEHNPSFISDNILYHNVCCPKSTIGELITRPPQYNKGKFYLKSLVHQTNINETNTNIII